MPFNFRMVLSGLMAVVPDRPFAKTIESASSVTLLMPNLLASRMLSTGEALDPHVPILEFKKLFRDENLSSRLPDLENLNKGTVLYRLEGEELEILPVPDLAVGFSLIGDRPVNKNKPSNAERRSLFWVTTMEQALPGRSKLRPGLLDGPLDGRGKIVTRIKIERGRLVTQALSPNICRFDPAAPEPFEQRVAVRLALEIDRVPRHVVLSMKRKGEEARRIVFAPPDGTSDVEVELTNREHDDILGLHPTVRPPDRALADFEIFYDLVDGLNLTREDARPALRQVFRRGDPQDPDLTRHAICPPTAFTA